MSKAMTGAPEEREAVESAAVDKFKMGPDDVRYDGARWLVTYSREEWAGGSLEGWYDVEFGGAPEVTFAAVNVTAEGVEGLSFERVDDGGAVSCDPADPEVVGDEAQPGDAEFGPAVPTDLSSEGYAQYTEESNADAYAAECVLARYRVEAACRAFMAAHPGALAFRLASDHDGESPPTLLAHVVFAVSGMRFEYRAARGEFYRYRAPKGDGFADLSLAATIGPEGIKPAEFATFLAACDEFADGDALDAGDVFMAAGGAQRWVEVSR